MKWDVPCQRSQSKDENKRSLADAYLWEKKPLRIVIHTRLLIFVECRYKSQYECNIRHMCQCYHSEDHFRSWSVLRSYFTAPFPRSTKLRNRINAVVLAVSFPSELKMRRGTLFLSVGIHKRHEVPVDHSSQLSSWKQSWVIIAVTSTGLLPFHFYRLLYIILDNSLGPGSAEAYSPLDGACVGGHPLSFPSTVQLERQAHLNETLAMWF